jgi:hypothetical protein
MKIQLGQQTIDNGQGQGGAIMAPVAHSTKHISQPQTKNAFLSSQGQTRTVKMDKPEQKVTKTFDYDKRKDRFSDHIPSSKKKYSNQNASSVNGTKIMIEI